MVAEAKGLNLKATPALKQLLTRAAENPTINSELRSQAAALAQEENVSWKKLRPIYMAVRDNKSAEGSPGLWQACKDGQVVLPASPPKKERDPELVARLQKLQQKEEERQYNAMVHDITGPERRAQAIREGGLVTYKDQLSYGLHIVVVLAVFYALGYLAASRISPKPTLKAAGGLSGLVVGMMVESVLLLIHTAKSQRVTATRKERKVIREQAGSQEQPVIGSLQTKESAMTTPNQAEPKKQK